MDNDTNSTELVISLEGISKRYREKDELSLKGINLGVKKGEFFCLVGPSGCGKSTLLKIVSSIEKPTDGKMAIQGDISMVFQSGALLPWLSVLENAAFGLKMRGRSKKESFSKALYFLEMMGLSDYLKKYPRELSGGQRQRVGIARALALETPILLLDEPFSALDLITTRELHKDLLNIWHQTQKTILMVSHSLEEAVTLADRVAIMEAGEIKKIVSIDLSRPRGERSSDFMDLVEKIGSEFKNGIAR